MWRRQGFGSCWRRRRCVWLGSPWELGGVMSCHPFDYLNSVMRSVEPGEDWGWCYVDEVMVEFG